MALSSWTEKMQRTFPYKLWKIINSTADNGVEWSSDGTHVEINKKLFVQKCLGNHLCFKTHKFLSITKQLNVYGFVQVPHNKSGIHPFYFSPNFKRGHPELLENFTRKIASVKKEKPSVLKQKKTALKERKVLSSIGNLPQSTRCQPLRQARLVNYNKNVFHYDIDTSPKTSSQKSSSSSFTAPCKSPSPRILKRHKVDNSAIAVSEARANFKRILHENVEQVKQLPTGLTSSSQSESSLIIDVSEQLAKYSPPPQRKDPEKVMWNGNCQQTPPRNGEFSINLNAFLTSPWKEYLGLDMEDTAACVIDLVEQPCYE